MEEEATARQAYNLAMKRISIQDLKSGLSAAIAEAEGGKTMLVTRHNRVVARLSPATPGKASDGGAALNGPLVPLLRRATRGRYLAVLMDDRRAEP